MCFEPRIPTLSARWQHTSRNLAKVTNLVRPNFCLQALTAEPKRFAKCLCQTWQWNEEENAHVSKRRVGLVKICLVVLVGFDKMYCIYVFVDLVILCRRVTSEGPTQLAWRCLVSTPKVIYNLCTSSNILGWVAIKTFTPPNSDWQLLLKWLLFSGTCYFSGVYAAWVVWFGVVVCVVVYYDVCCFALELCLHVALYLVWCKLFFAEGRAARMENEWSRMKLWYKSWWKFL